MTPRQMIAPTLDDKMAWALFAMQQYNAGNRELGHRYSAFASLPSGNKIWSDVYQTLNDNMQQGPR